MTRRVVAVALVVAMMVAAVAWGVPVGINPKGTEGVAYGRIRIADNADRACLNVKLHPSTPGSPENGDLYVVDDGATVHRICFRSGGSQFCGNATLTP